MQRATRLELAAFSHENIALHRPSHLHRFRPDLTAYARVLPDRERSGGIDCALYLSVDEQLVQEFDRAFDQNSSGEKSAGLRWHERAGGWPWDDRWSGRFVCGDRGFGLSSEHLHSVIPPGLAAWKAYLFPCATTGENKGLFATLHDAPPIQNFEEGKNLRGDLNE